MLWMQRETIDRLPTSKGILNMGVELGWSSLGGKSFAVWRLGGGNDAARPRTTWHARHGDERVCGDAMRRQGSRAEFSALRSSRLAEPISGWQGDALSRRVGGDFLPPPERRFLYPDTAAALRGMEMNGHRGEGQQSGGVFPMTPDTSGRRCVTSGISFARRS